MSEESANRWWVGLIVTLALAVFGMFVSWNAWMTLQIVSHSAELRTLSLQQSNVISPVVEQSLREIRQKTNEQYEAYSDGHQKLLEIANQNRSDVRDVQKDIAQIKEILSKTPK